MACIGIMSLVNWTTKEMKRWGFGNVDDTNAISASMVTEVYGKCHSLLVRLNPPEPEKVTSSSWWKMGHYHGGFLRQEFKGYSPTSAKTVQLYSVYPITAKHNLRTVAHETKGVFKPTAASFTVNWDNGVDVDWPDLAWEEPKKDSDDMLDLRKAGAGTMDSMEASEARPATATAMIAEFGFDVSIGSTIYDPSNPCCRAEHSFDRVRKTLKLEKGMKVGMAVVFSKLSKPTPETITGNNKNVKLPPDFQQDDIIENFFGLPDQLNIYTGEILYVGPNFIEYNINSFTGCCAGAIVFLLDQNQPPSVDAAADYGTAVAIHSAAHPVLTDRNYGFLINEHPVFKGL